MSTFNETLCSETLISLFDGATAATKAATLCAQLGTTTTGIETAFADADSELTVGINTMFLVLNGALVFVMHAGFAMVRGRV